MFKREIDEIYELCKRAINETSNAHVTFNLSVYGLDMYGLKNKNDINKPHGEFKWDLFTSICFNDDDENLKRIKETEAFLLGLLIEGKCSNE